MTKYKLDAVTAWHELARFAEAACIELDDRAHPEYDEDDDTDEEIESAEKLVDDEPRGESDIADYDDVLMALRRGDITVDDRGALTVHWRQPPIKDRETLVFDPQQDNGSKPAGWPYSKAIQALATKPVAPAVSRRARKREKPQEESQMEKLANFCEVLSGYPKGSLSDITNKRDHELIVSLFGLICQ